MNRMMIQMRSAIAATAVLAVMSVLWLAGAPAAEAQNLFEPVIRVNDQAITRYEIEQRARMMTLFRAPGDPTKVAREQLVEERLKLDAALAAGFVLEDEVLDTGVEEFAGRANMDAEQLIRALDGAGVYETTLRDFVKAGLTWRELVQVRFSARVTVNEADLERARRAVAGTTGVRVLLSEIIMPAPPAQIESVMQRAGNISEIRSIPEFSSAARRYSAASTAGRGGQLNWMPITNLPPALRSVVLGLAPGEVSDPLPADNAVALFQLRDIEETETAEPEYAAIEYAAYYVAGGRTDQAMSRAASVRARADTCDDLYGVAQGEPPEVLERGSKAPGEIPQDIAFELAKLDPGEISTNLTRSNGQTLVVLMLCGRSPQLEGEGPSAEDLTNFIRDRRLDSFANGYLEELRAEARIVETE